MQKKLDDYTTKPFADLQTINGIEFPAQMRFRQLLVTGPPGSGKSTMIRNIKGWPEEGYIDLTLNKWWKTRALSMRPREIHLGLPCEGFDNALTVFDEEWKRSAIPPKLDLTRIKIPPDKKYFFSTNWRDRYYFEFLIPPFQILYQRRKKRKKRGTHPVDDYVNPSLVNHQVEVFREIAYYFYTQGLNVYIRETTDAPPMQITYTRG